MLAHLHQTIPCLVAIFTALTLNAATATERPLLTLTSPPDGVVFQRNLDGIATIHIEGKLAIPAAVHFRFIASNAPSERIARWIAVTNVSSTGIFQTTHTLSHGWHTLDIRLTSTNNTNVVRALSGIGVGEVFIIMGHSVAQGGDLNLPGSTDVRVRTIPLAPEPQKRYEKSGAPSHLPDLAGIPFSDAVKPAPFGHGPYFWAKLGERLAARESVPVLILNAAFGGTSLEHWAKSARGETFTHSFVKSEIRMPYINLHNALEKYAKVLGLRAILSDHGQNDASEMNEEIIFHNYKTVIDQARRDLGFAAPIAIVRQTPYRTKVPVRRAQQRIVDEIPQCFAGPDYDTLKPEARPDQIHLSHEGMAAVAEAWANALDARFFRTARPFIP